MTTPTVNNRNQSKPTQGGTMKRVLALLCVAGVLFAGCKSSDEKTDSSTDTSQPTEVLSTEPGQGVTETTIKIGAVYPDLAAIKDIVNIDHGDYLSAFKALADDINASGGINGRMIEIVDGPVDPVATDAATSICTKLTEDEGVFAAVGNVQADSAACYVTDHDTALIGGQQNAENTADTTAPWFTFNADLDYQAGQVVKGIGDEEGFAGKKVGVVYIPIDRAFVEGDFSDQLADAGADVVEQFVIDTPKDDQAAADAQVATAAEKFKSSGIDVVVTVADAFQPFATGIAKTDYRPQLVATSGNVVEGFLVGADDSRYAVLNGLVAGGPPPLRVGWNDPAMQSCVERIKKQQPDRVIDDPTTANADTPNTWVSVAVACQSMTLFEAILEKAGTTVNNDTFRQAGENLGTLEIPGAGGPSDYTPDTPSGNPPVFLGTWNSASKSLDYATSPVS